MSGLRLLGSCLAAAVLVGWVTAAGVSAAGAQRAGLKITVFPRQVAQGGLEQLAAAVPGSAKCSLTVRYANGRRQALGNFAAGIVGGLEWTWGVPTAAGVGTARARVACAGIGARTGTFVVERLHRSSVAVVKRGFTQLPDGNGGTTISWGIVLRNHSHKEARGVQLELNFLDAAGHLIIQDGGSVAGIAPGARYYEADVERTAGFPVVAKIAVSVRVSRRKSGSALPIAPTATDLQLSADSFDGSALVEGTVTNDGTEQLSSRTGIVVVFFNSAGEVIGGASTPLPSTLAPGAQTTFEIDTAPGGPPASHVAQVGVQVDPLYGSG